MELIRISVSFIQTNVTAVIVDGEGATTPVGGEGENLPVGEEGPSSTIMPMIKTTTGKETLFSVNDDRCFISSICTHVCVYVYTCCMLL